MANLNAMFGKKADATPTADAGPATQTEQAAPVQADAVVEAAAETATQDAPAQVVRKGLGFLGKSSGANVPAVDKAAVSPATTPAAQAKPKLAGLSLGKAKPESAPAVPVDLEDSTALINLDDLMNDESAAPERVARPRPTDHIDATAPTRPVPEDASPQMLNFVKLIDSVYEMQFDQDLLGNVIKSIMVELQTNPIYINADWKKSLVQPDDIRVWIRNMREVMGLNKIVKAEKKAKRATSKAKKVDSNEMLDDLASLGFTLET